MVHEKARSGDPDFDDKVPADQHGGKTVTAGDGREVLLTESNGPVNLDGTHANLDDPKGEAGDNRPEPGGVATEPSEVQTYDAADTAIESLGEAGSQEEAEKLAEPDKAAEQAEQDKKSQAAADELNADAPPAATAAPAPTGRRRAQSGK